MIANCFVISWSWVVDKVEIACVGVGHEGGNKVFMNGVVVAVYPAYPPHNQLSPMFANNRLNVFASGYHKSQVRLKSDNDGLRGSLLDTPPHIAQ